MNNRTIITAILALVAIAGRAQTKESFFQADSATIIGRIVGLEPETMPKQVFVAWNNALTDISKGNVVNIEADGSFTCQMLLQHPILSTFSFSQKEQIQYYLTPGETLHMTLRQDASGQWNCDYDAKSSAKQVERLLKANLDFTNEYLMMLEDKDDLQRHTALCDILIHTTSDRVNDLADAKQFTTYERQLAQTMATSMVCAGFLFRHGELMRSDLMRALSDSTFSAELSAPTYYAPLKYLPLNDPILFVPHSFSQLTRIAAALAAIC